jgi:hypothetical protein
LLKLTSDSFDLGIGMRVIHVRVPWITEKQGACQRVPACEINALKYAAQNRGARLRRSAHGERPRLSRDESSTAAVRTAPPPSRERG